jgi:aminoglycoside phosphotransferase family enzyme/predicted kinase
MSEGNDAGGDGECHDELVRWLESGAAWTGDPQPIQRIETHISQVFLSADRVYKLKKPVRFDFLDFSTVQAREHACREEVRLNRRLAADVYLGVKAITVEANGSFRFDGPGQVVDWLVEMKRLPADRMMDALHIRHALRPDDVEQLASLLVGFYESLTGAVLTSKAYHRHCLSHVHDNCTELLAEAHSLDPAAVLRTHGFQLQMLHLNSIEFDQRVQSGKIVDGHGDLRPEHICFTDPIAIFDCIEFSSEFRQLDRADELAFLVSECEILGAGWAGERLWSRYQAISDDRPSRQLFDFYRTYRASVRTKVAALRATQLAGNEKQQALKDAFSHLHYADRVASPHLRPLVLAIGGLSGTGKTTLAQALAKEFAAELLRSDVIRQKLFPENAQSSELATAKYSPESRQQVYHELFRRAGEIHRQKISVILDATFSTRASILDGSTLAADRASLFLAIECTCRPETSRERIALRRARGSDASEATADVYEQQRQTWEKWPSHVPQCQVDTEQPVHNQVARVIETLRSIAGTNTAAGCLPESL